MSRRSEDELAIHWHHEDMVIDHDYTLPGEQLELS